MKKNVVVFSRLAADLVERLGQQYNVTELDPSGDVAASLAAALPQAHGLIGVGRKWGAEQLAGAANLEVIASISVGYDSYDLEYLHGRGITLTNTPDVLTETTADLGFTLLLSAARRIVELDGWMRAGQWQATLGPELFGCDVHGKTLGILGMGNIGAALARRGRFGFGMRVLYNSNSRKPALEQEMGAQYRDLDGLLAESDFICVVVPLSQHTRRMIGPRELALMKSSAILVNLARGPIIDEAALIEALQSGQIRAAGLDVFEQEPLRASPLFSLSNVVTVPHIGSATHETRRAMAELAVRNLEAALQGEIPPNRVNPST